MADAKFCNNLVADAKFCKKILKKNQVVLIFKVEFFVFQQEKKQVAVSVSFDFGGVCQ